MSTKTDLQSARDDMLAILDAKLNNMPEWRAFRAMDRALAAMIDDKSDAATQRPKIPRKRSKRVKLSYVELALGLIDEAGAPVSTNKIVEHIAVERGLKADDRQVRINIQSALSKDPRVKSIPWREGRAWWRTDRPVPTSTEAAGNLPFGAASSVPVT